MRPVITLALLFCFGAVPLELALSGERTGAQAPAQKATIAMKTAEQQYKNIQVLKGIPADQLIPSMQFISASLGVQCDFCHVEHQMEKDDKQEKKTAREMIKMVYEINADSFEGKTEVTCNTCHRGSPHPMGVPQVASVSMMNMSKGHGEEAHEEDSEDGKGLPSAQQILGKYLAAVGGADALKKIHSRVQKGTLEAMGSKYPIDVYSEAPDKRISISHPPTGDSVTAFNGDVGWLTLRGGIHRMNAAEAEAARMDAEIYFPIRVREMFPEFHVRAGGEIDGHPTVKVLAQAEGKPPVELYFDTESGLLVRLVRYAQTPLGRNPTQIDYADYRAVDGVKIPFSWTLARPNGAFTIRVEQVQQNVPVDEKLFVEPEEK